MKKKEPGEGRHRGQPAMYERLLQAGLFQQDESVIDIAFGIHPETVIHD